MTTIRTLVGLLLVSLCINVALAYRISDLTERQTLLARRAVLKIGEWAEPFVAQEHGQPVEVHVDTKQVVFYVVSATCQVCKTNMEQANMLVKHAATTYEVFYVSVDDNPHVRQELSIPVGVRLLQQPTPRTRSQYGLSGTPQTVVVRDGRIVANWVGDYQGRNLEEIQRFFKLKELPRPS
jgi:hypothetical protein